MVTHPTDISSVMTVNTNQPERKETCCGCCPIRVGVILIGAIELIEAFICLILVVFDMVLLKYVTIGLYISLTTGAFLLILGVAINVWYLLLPYVLFASLGIVHSAAYIVLYIIEMENFNKAEKIIAICWIFAMLFSIMMTVYFISVVIRARKVIGVPRNQIQLA
ncbi:hypothetical protein M3Y98_00676500 [Aphelenchoides besseyi]|nr:hypothetical protein M3Y98_00676500 [Aphelenchoides besseyi]KAI6209136.1 hypothetical protein M3Y96_00189100 [Aphelenchoides besseyi]